MTAPTSMEQVEAFLAMFANEVATQVAAKLASQQPDDDELLKLDETGRMLGVSERAVRKLIAGDPPVLESVLVGDGARRVQRREIKRYVASLQRVSR